MVEVTEKKRIQNLDMARTFAIICVILCHSIETAYSDIIYTHLSNISQVFRIIFFTIGRLGVPIFLFLTGALTLKKQIENDEDVKKFYKRNLLPLFITIEIWNVLYNILLIFINKQFSISILLKNIFFFKQVNLSNMWYMPMILGMYFAIPFIAKIVKTFTLKTMKIPMIAVFLSSILLPSINILFDLLNLEQYKLILDFSFFGGGYGLYIILGYYINNGLLKKYSNVFLALTGGLNFVVTCIFQYISFKVGKGYNVWYSFITLFICAICIFELFTRIKNREIFNIYVKSTRYISNISLALFFVHKLFINTFVKYTGKFDINNPIESIILFILSSICSIVFVYITSKIKFIKEKVFLIKD